MKKVLKRGFFKKPALDVAENLLSKVLVRKNRGKIFAVKITEIEIYDGFEDKASHASRGKTERNKIMFEEGGYFYIYLIYGMHFMINIVVGKKDHPSAILLRGGDILFSNSCELENNTRKNYSSVPYIPAGEVGNSRIEKVREMNKNQQIGKHSNILENVGMFVPQHLSGPGKLSKFLKVSKKFNGELAASKNNLWFEDWGIKISKNKIKKTARVGVNYAGPYWSNKKWRFFIKN